jgi:D-alanyl-D-alanine endopeptidase (penicillin-binding protein 7)
MKKAQKVFVFLLSSIVIGVGSLPADAMAAAKKKHHVTKHHAKPAKPAKKAATARAHKVSYRPASLSVQSSAVLVQEQATGTVLFEKNASAVMPIASITKLMTAMVVLDAKQDLSEELTVDDADVDTLRGSRSRLPVGTHLTREEMLRLALMSSENRAASALSRHYPGGQSAFVAAMNAKAAALGMTDSRFLDPTGLNASNVSTPRDLARMVNAAHSYPLIREFTTTPSEMVDISGHVRQFNNTNALIRSSNSNWDIGLSKTGYINEAGRCLVMQAEINHQPVIIVLLDSVGKMTRIGDANRIKNWFEASAQRRSTSS